MTKLKALHAFSGQEGVIFKDAEFSVTKERAEILIQGGHAVLDEVSEVKEDVKPDAKTTRKD